MVELWELSDIAQEDKKKGVSVISFWMTEKYLLNL